MFSAIELRIWWLGSVILSGQTASIPVRWIADEDEAEPIGMVRLSELICTFVSPAHVFGHNLDREHCESLFRIRLSIMVEQQSDEERLPGLPRDEFNAAVETIASLRESGKFLLFLSRAASVRLIGERDVFRAAYAKKLGQDSVNQKTASQALQETRNFLATWIAFRDIESALDFLEKAVFDDDLEKLSEGGKSRFRELLTEKTNLVRDKLFTAAMSHRAERTATASSPCLEDLDVEVVAERRDQLSDEKISQPFLRLRLRYTDGSREGATIFHPTMVFSPGWLRLNDSIRKSFEIECDETDIDLLLRRLVTAKEQLLQFISSRSEQEQGD